MANPGYVRSTDGSDADNGSTWALANATIAGAITDAAAGDRIWVSQAHAESTAASVSWSFPGTLVSPNQILCGSDAAEPPTSLSTASTFTTTGTSNITALGSLFWYGGTISCGTGPSQTTLTLSNGDGNLQRYESVKFVIGSTASASRIRLGTSGISIENRLELINCTFKFGATSQGLRAHNLLMISGGSIDSAGSLPATLFATATSDSLSAVIEAFDASSLASTFNWFPSGCSHVGKVIIRNCKVPASWTGGLIAGAVSTTGCRFEAYNLDSSGTNYRIWVEDYPGSIIQETTIVKSGGASDGTTPLAWKMVTNANAEYPLLPLASPEMQLWNDTSGSSKTVSVEVLTDNVTLTDAEAWLEVLYLGSSSSTLGTISSDQVASVIASTANQDSSSVTWTTTGLATPVKQTLSVTFTPQQKGPFVCVVKLAKASTTMYVDPQPTVT